MVEGREGTGTTGHLVLPPGNRTPKSESAAVAGGRARWRR